MTLTDKNVLTLDKLEAHSHEWRVKDIITNQVIICYCENCDEESEFIMRSYE